MLIYERNANMISYSIPEIIGSRYVQTIPRAPL